jgi:uncharacterized delta-60 repeat protein
MKPRLSRPPNFFVPALATATLATAGLAQAQGGNLDLGLNGGQLVATQCSPSSSLRFPANGIVAWDGKVLVVGRSQGASGNIGWSIIRYEADGDLDTTFSGDGRLELFQSSIGTASAQDLVLYPDGRILVVGDYYVANNHGGSWEFGIVRLHEHGALDTSFGNGGIARVSFGNNRIDHARAVLLQPDNRIVVGGTSRSSNSDSLVLARLTAGGQLDGTFGKSGKSTPLVIASPGGYQFLWLKPGCIALDGAGRIVVGGAGQSSTGAWRIARYTAAGKLDNSFGSGGIVTDTLATSILFDVAITPSGQIVASGTFGNAGRTETAVIRYSASGARDASFGIGGFASTIGSAAMPAGLEFHGNACVVQPDGKIVVGGYTLDTTGARYMAPFRFLANGAKDAGFGVDGLGQPANLGPSSLFQGVSIALDDEDRLVIGGGDGGGGPYAASVAWMRWL